MSTKVFEIVTQRVTDLLKAGTIPWKKPWKGGAMRPCNISGNEYNGVNFFLMSCLGHDVPVYLTLKQINAMGGRIKEGENKNHTPVFFWAWVQSKDATDDKKFPLMRYYLVWNISQVEGIQLPAKFVSKPATNEYGTLEAAEAIVAGYKGMPQASEKKNGDRACYYPTVDRIEMPEKNQFNTLEEYYSTLFHEMVHSTGHSSRLNRKELTDANYFGSHDYSAEELTAEMGAAYLCAEAGIDNTLANSAAYIAGWLKKLASDPKMLMMAAARAQKAFHYIRGTTPSYEKE